MLQNRLPIKAGAAGGVKVEEDKLPAHSPQLDMLARDTLVGDDQVIFRGAADADNWLVEWEETNTIYDQKSSRGE